MTALLPLVMSLAIAVAFSWAGVLSTPWPADRAHRPATAPWSSPRTAVPIHPGAMQAAGVVVDVPADPWSLSTGAPVDPRSLPAKASLSSAPWPAVPVLRPATGAGPAPGRWWWPLAGRPVVTRGFDPPPQPWLPGHRGVDLGAAEADEVRAAGAGVVAFAGEVAGRGVVSIDHAGGLRTTYEPVLSTVDAGQAVGLGEPIG